MANNFNIVARLNLQGPNNVRQVVRQIQSQLNSITANVQINVANNVNQRLNTVNTNLQRLDASIRSIRASSIAANQSLQQLVNTINQIGKNSNFTVTVNGLNNVNKNANQAAKSVANFGNQAGLAVRRFIAFAAPTSIFLGLVTAIKEGVSASIEFEKELTRLSQVTGRSISALTDLSNEITRLATGLGVSSQELSKISTTLAQAGLSAKDTKVALEALARSSLAATFDDIEATTEGAIATFQQFQIGAEDLQGVIGSLNSVSAQFAVESDDLISAIRRTGGAFRASGGNLNELLGLFTSVRATTRESADSIATGFRTIFTRIQRPRTIQFLKELGVQLQDAEGQFIGPLESIRRLNAALSEIETTDPRFAAVIEELGGFRQVSKVIPLIQQFPEALKAISVAEQGQLSIVEDSIVAQQSLANQITKVKEEFLALFRELTSDKTFQRFVREVLDLSKGLIEVTRAIKPLIPLIGGLAALQIGRNFNLASFAQSFSGRKFASGGIVPGSGNRDTVPAMLTPGEFVINKKSAEAIGFDKLRKINKFAKGGAVREFGLAALQPVNFKRREDEEVQYISPVTKKPVKEKVNITVGGLTKEFANSAEKKIKEGVFRATSSVASSLQKAIGAEQSQPANINKILQNAGLSSVIGTVFESSLALAGAPYEDKAGSNAPIDFPSGLGTSLSQLFGKDFPSSVPTDAKRTASVKSFKRANIVSFLKEQAKKTGATQTLSSTNLNKAGNLQALYNNLSEDQKTVVKDVASGKVRLDRSQSLLRRFFGKDVKKNQLQALQLAEGGGIPGSGSGDSVPALLTPGEFVINKKSAKALGSAKLNALNKVQKFAKGGRVQKFQTGGRVAPGGRSLDGFGFATTAALSLGSAFFDLEGETGKLVNSITAVIGGATALSFSLKSLANERKLQTLSRTGLGGSSVPNVLGLRQTTRTLAKNFNTLSVGVGVASSALTIYGQTVQDAALEQAKGAKTQADLNKAISSDQGGSALSGAGIGAGIGAAVGTAIAPGIGTAVGAAIGGIAGAITGAINNNQKELIKAFRQARFDEAAEKLDNLFEDFSSGRVGVQRSAVDIGGALNRQLGNISSTSDLSQRQELTKQLRNQLVSVRNLSSEIVKTSSTIDEFKNAFGGTGNILINSISVLTKKSIPEVIEQINNEISARNIAVKAEEERVKSIRETEKLVVSIRVFNDAIKNVTESLNSVQSSFDLLVSLSQGTVTGGSFTGIAPDLFSRAASGNINDASRVSRATAQLTSSLDADSTNAINETVISVTKLTASLPDILEKVASGIGLTGGAERGEEVFNREINSLDGVSDELKTVAKAIFASEIASREGGGEGGLAKTVREDIVGFANKLVPEALKASVQQLDEVTKSFSEQIDIIGRRLVENSRLELQISSQKVALEEKILEFSKSRLTGSDRLSDEAISGAVSRRRSELLSGTAFFPERPLSEFGDRITAISKEIVEQQNILNTAGAGTEAQLNAQKAIVGLQTEASRLTNFLKDVSESSIELARAQENLTRAEEDRRSTRNLLEDLLFGNGAGRVAFKKFAVNAQRINSGETNLGRLSEKDRSSFLDILNRLPQNGPVPGLGGKTVQQFKDEQFTAVGRDKGFTTVVAEKIIKDLIEGTTKPEVDARDALVKVQEQAIEAERELIRVNEGLAASISAITFEDLNRLPDLIKNATIDAITSGLSTQNEFLQRDLGGRQAQLGRLDFLGNRLGINSREGTIDFANKVRTSESLFRQRGTSLSRIQELRNINRSSISSNISNSANQLKSGIAFNTLDSDILNKTLNNVLEKNILQPNDQDKLRKALQERLENIAILQPSNPGNIRKDFTQGTRGIPLTGFRETFQVDRTAKTGKFALNTIINDLVTEELNKFITSETGVAARTGAQAQNKLSKTFSFEQIEKLSNTKNLDNFLADLNDLDESFFKGEKGLKNYVEQIKNLNAQIAEVKTRIDSLNAGRPAPATPKARGGFVGGTSISRPLTTFTPKGTDRIPAILSKDEFVVNSSAAKANAPLLEAMNMARGGRVRFTREQQRDVLRKRRSDRGDTIFSRSSFIANNKAKKTARGLSREDRISMTKISKDIDKKFAIADLKASGLINRETGKTDVSAINRDRADDFRERDFRLPEGGLVGTRARDLFASKSAVIAGEIERKALFAREDRSKDLERIKDSLLFAKDERAADLKRKRAELDAKIVARDKALAERKKLRGFASGGIVPGAGNRDSVPSLLTPGEFVLNRRAAKSLGLNTLKNFNARFQNGGVVSPTGGGGGGMFTLSPESLSSLQSFSKGFIDGVNILNSGLSRFSEMSSQLSNVLSNWNSVAGRLSESLAAFPSEVQVNHSPITVAVNISGVEGLEESIKEKVLAAVNQTMSNARSKAADGKSPFFAR